MAGREKMGSPLRLSIRHPDQRGPRRAPNFGDEKGVADTSTLSGMKVPICSRPIRTIYTGFRWRAPWTPFAEDFGLQF